MAVSIVLRLVRAALAEGRIAGEAEHVETGRRAVVRDADELVAFLLSDDDAALAADGARTEEGS